MKILDNTTEACFVVDDDLLDFTLEDGKVEEEVDPSIFKGGASASSSSLESSNPAAATETVSFVRDIQTGSFPEFVEEELEWLSNKDAFPAVETCFGILSDNPELISNHQSPISVLENSSNSNTKSTSVVKVQTNYPVRARTKRRRGKAGLGDSSSQHCFGPGQVNYVVKNKLPPLPVMTNGGGSGGGTTRRMVRRCLHCQSDKTPQWRAGPMGPKTLCNACGVRYKSGRLLPEYRPANSPTFSSVLHSNSHRKVVEMRRQKQVASGEEGVAGLVDIGHSNSRRKVVEMRRQKHAAAAGGVAGLVDIG